MGFGSPQAHSITISIDFEAVGDIQGLYFLNHCKEQGIKLGLYGWIKHSHRGTIVGIIQGRKPKVFEMIAWMTEVGSPGCKIDNVCLYNYRYVPRPEFRGFSARL